MIAPAIPETHREPVTDIDPLRCVGCDKVIFNTTFCIEVKKKLWCSEECCDRAALRKLRAV